MADILTKRERSLRMSRVRQKHTAPERALRRALHALGFRFRLHAPELAGHPDIVLPKYGVAIFVHGCFWHGHSCRAGRSPATNRSFWLPKIEANRLRDARKVRALRALGWHVFTIWECQLKRPDKAEVTANRISRAIAAKNLEPSHSVALRRRL